jgi:hypothetical protein
MAKLEILFNDLPRSRSDESYVRAQVKNWLRRNAYTGSAKVEFFSSPFDQRVGCYVEVLQEGTLHRNFEYGKGVPNTLLRCLRSLHENSSVEHQTERSA